jgi:hypothetical protein
MPPGTRHNALPTSGVSAKTRIMSVERVKSSALKTETALSKEGSETGLGEFEC